MEENDEVIVPKEIDLEESSNNEKIKMCPNNPFFEAFDCRMNKKNIMRKTTIAEHMT